MQSVKTFEQDLKKDREEYIIDVLEYTQKSFDDVYRDLYRGEILMRDEWNEKNPQTPEESARANKEPAPNARFDMILCFDVLEHIPLEEAKKTVELLGSLKASRAKVLLTAPFEKTSLNPMHFNRNEELDKLIQKFLSKDVLYTSEDVLYTKILGEIMTKAA
jgi:hypothetical protein